MEKTLSGVKINCRDLVFSNSSPNVVDRQDNTIGFSGDSFDWFKEKICSFCNCV